MRNLSEGNVAKTIIVFALPMIAMNILQQCYGMADAVIVGNFIGKTALAAVGASVSIVFLLSSFASGITTGMGVLIGHYYGKGNIEKVKQAITTSWIIIIFLSILLTIIGFFSSRFILELLHTPSEIIEQASIYLSIISAGISTIFFYNMASGILRALGDSITSLKAIIIATIANISLDIFFVYTLKMNVEGAAIATVISQGFSFLYLAIYLKKNHKILHTSIKEIKFNKELTVEGLKLGLPNGIQQMLVALGMMILMSVINPFGVDATAAFSAAFRIDSFASMPAMNISLALTAFVAQNIGAGNIERAKKGYQTSIILALIIAFSITAIILLSGTFLMNMFNADQNVVKIGTDYLQTVSIFYTFFCIMFVTNGIIRGAGSAIIPLISTMIALWFIRIPFAIILSQFYGLKGIYYSIPLGWITGSIISFIYYKSERWKKIKI